MWATGGQFFRVLKIQRVLVRHGFDELIFGTAPFTPIRFLLYLLPWNWVRRQPHAPRAERILHVLEDLGPIFVKFGQLLSTRRDLLPEDIANALANLQDRVPPFAGAEARRIVEEAYGQAITEAFRSFEERPLASASIAQVHAAETLDGKRVVVKVVRPGIEKIIRRDLGLARTLAMLAERYWEDGRRLRPTGVVDEYERVILDELDLMREAANSTQLRRNFRDEPRMHVPQVYWDMTRRNVLVLERIDGIPIDDVDALDRAGIDRRELAEVGVELFFTQVFRDRYFHADMHPGNLFVLAPEGELPLRIAPVDFGIMGSLSDFDQRYLADNFLAFLKRDYQRVAQLHVESGWVPADTRVDQFEFAIRAVCEPMLERPLREISFGHLLLRLFQTAQRFHMKILPQLLLLQKTLVNIEGVGRELHPELDLWRAARPQIERWIAERTGLRNIVRETRENLPHWLERLPEVPDLVFDLLSKAGHGQLVVRSDSHELTRLRAEIRRANARTVMAVAGAAFVLGAVVLLAANHTTPHAREFASWLPWVLGVVGVVLFASARSD